ERDRGLRGLPQLLQDRAAGYDSLFDFAGRKLDFEIAGILFRQFVHSKENWLESRQLRNLIDLLIEQLKFIERILVFRSHDAILPYLAFGWSSHPKLKWTKASPALKMRFQRRFLLHIERWEQNLILRPRFAGWRTSDLKPGTWRCPAGP